MKKALGAMFAIGVATGSLVTWVYGHASARTADSRVPPIGTLLKSAEADVTRDGCDARFGRTVGDVLGGILDAGLASGRNPYSYSCVGSTCRFSVTNCTPWKDTECGGTLLEFEMDSQGSPRAGTFTCLDVP